MAKPPVGRQVFSPTAIHAADSEASAVISHAMTLVNVPINDLAPDPNQPRQAFSPEEMELLRQSISKHGVLNPIQVKRLRTGSGKAFQIVSGERRYRASKEAGLSSVPAIIIEEDKDHDLIGLIDNVQRVDLNVVELAQAVVRLRERTGVTQAQIGAVIHKSQADVAGLLAVTTLPQDILDEYLEVADRIGHRIMHDIARHDGSIADKRTLWEAAKAGATVRDVNELRKKLRQGPAQKLNPPVVASLLVAKSLKKVGVEIAALQRHREGLTLENRQSLGELRSQIDELLR